MRRLPLRDFDFKFIKVQLFLLSFYFKADIVIVFLQLALVFLEELHFELLGSLSFQQRPGLVDAVDLLDQILALLSQHLDFEFIEFFLSKLFIVHLLWLFQLSSSCWAAENNCLSFVAELIEVLQLYLIFFLNLIIPLFLVLPLHYIIWSMKNKNWRI